MVKPAAKPEVSTEELSYRKELFPEISSIKNKNVLCTSCNKSVKELMLKGKCKTHPFLETLLCEKCFEFFGDGEFSVDEDGSDKYCRWCGQGGTLFLCSTCTAGFCKKCIKRNLARSALNEVEDDNWKCYCCEVKPLYDLRAYCWAAKQYFEEKGDLENTKKRKVRQDSSSDEEEKLEKENKKRKGHSNNEIEMHKKEIKIATKQLNVFLADTTKLIEVAKKKAEEYKNKKSYVKSLRTIEEVCAFSEKIDSALDIVESSSQKMRSNLKEYMKNWKKLVGENSTEKVDSGEGDEKKEAPNNSSDNSIEKSPAEKEKNGSADEAEMKDEAEEPTGNGEGIKEVEEREPLTETDENEEPEELKKTEEESPKHSPVKEKDTLDENSKETLELNEESPISKDKQREKGTLSAGQD